MIFPISLQQAAQLEPSFMPIAQTLRDELQAIV